MILTLSRLQIRRLEFVHSRGIVVRDVKPENFAMGLESQDETSSTVYIFDFDLAKLYIDP